MRSDVARDLTDSATAFVQYVWPCIRFICGGGEVLPVESTTNKGLENDLDILAGIDAWQIIREKSVMRGIASRVQWLRPGIKEWNTFTIRYKRTSGATTEFEKRLFALQHRSENYLLPHFTVQAYFRLNPLGQRTTNDFLSLGVVKTLDLYRYLLKYRMGMVRSNGDDGNEFLFAPWSDMEQKGVEVYVDDLPF